MKAHTYYIIFGRPPIGGKLPPSPDGATGLCPRFVGPSRRPTVNVPGSTGKQGPYVWLLSKHWSPRGVDVWTFQAAPLSAEFKERRTYYSSVNNMLLLVPPHPADLQWTQWRDFRNRTRKPGLTFPKTEKPVLQKEPGFGNPTKVRTSDDEIISDFGFAFAYLIKLILHITYVTLKFIYQISTAVITGNYLHKVSHIGLKINIK